MKKALSLLLASLLLCMTLSITACDKIEQTLDNANPSSVQYQKVTIEKSQTLHGALALVNDTHTYQFPEGATKNLANISEYRTAHTAEGKTSAYKISYHTLLLDSAAIEAAHAWLTDFNKATGKSDTIITSAYRTYEEQASFSIPQGKSDHHTGFGVTLKIYDGTNTFEINSDPAYAWLAENAYKYGLTVRYPEGKDTITGITDYTNYFHYVGYAPAAYMQANNLCLEEFVAAIKAYSVENPLAVTDANGLDWLVYYAACPGDMATIDLPANFTYTISGDNEGGVIVCVSLSKSAAQGQ